MASAWVYFFAGEEMQTFSRELQAMEGSKDYYDILEVRQVAGAGSTALESKQPMIRIETASPLSSSAKPQARFKGGVRHLQYTGSAVRTELQKASAAPYAPSETTLAVLIPIRKSAAIGSDYAAKIYRKLYHSRYLETLPALDYDFLTYFEFEQKDKPLFSALLAELRNTELNPEWAFVNWEMEVWMAKKGRSLP